MRKGKLLLAISLLFGLCSSSALAAEKLEYEVKMLGTEFGSATLYINGADTYGHLKTNEKWSSVHFINNRIASRTWRDGFPRHTQIEYRVKDKHKKYAITFGRKQIRSSRTSNKGPNRRSSFKPKQRMHDVISWLAKVRTMVVHGFNAPLSFKVFSGVRSYDVECTPLKVETISTPLGMKVAKPYNITITRSKDYKRKFKVWFDTARGHTPLRLVGKFKLGNAEVLIKSIKRSATKAQ